MKKRGQNRHKYLFAMASLCAAISMIFNAVTIKNVLACHDIMARTEALSERAAGLKNRNLAQKKGAFCVGKRDGFCADQGNGGGYH